MRRRYSVLLLIAALALVSALIALRPVRRSDSALFRAVMRNNAESVKRLIRDGHNPDISNEPGSTPLHWAAEAGFQECAEALVEGGASLNPIDIFKNTPLHMAASEDKAGIVKFLLSKGADPNASNADGRAPLHTAVRNFARLTAEVLLKGGAQIDARDADGRTPLFGAVQMGDKPTVKLLVEYGANLTVQDKKGLTPIDLVAGDSTMARLLLQSSKKEPKD